MGAAAAGRSWPGGRESIPLSEAGSFKWSTQALWRSKHIDDRLLASYPSSSARKQLSRATCKRPSGRSAAIIPGPAEGPIQRRQALGTGCIAVLPVGGSMERFARSFGPCSARRSRGAAAGQDNSEDSARRLAQLGVGAHLGRPVFIGQRPSRSGPGISSYRMPLRRLTIADFRSMW